MRAGLAWWHPLVSGDPNTVHTSGVSVRGKVAVSEQDVPDERLEEYIVSWPGKWPKGARQRGAVKRKRGREGQAAGGTGEVRNCSN